MIAWAREVRDAYVGLLDEHLVLTLITTGALSAFLFLAAFAVVYAVLDPPPAPRPWRTTLTTLAALYAAVIAAVPLTTLAFAM